jgi:aryl carrier-like protein
MRPLITPATAAAVAPAVGVVPMPPVTAPASPVPTAAPSTAAVSTAAVSTGRAPIAALSITPLTQTLIALDDGARRARLFTHLAGAIQATLKRPADDAIPLRQPLFDFGLDSILALELKEQLERDFGITLKATVLFTHPTLEALVDHLLAGLPAEAAEAAPAANDGEDIAALLRLALQSQSTST